MRSIYIQIISLFISLIGCSDAAMLSTRGAGSAQGFGQFGKVTTGICAHGVTVITTIGAGYWTVPANCTSITIEAIGGGGYSDTSAYPSGGSGGGAYAKDNAITVTGGQTVYYSLGKGVDSWVNVSSNSTPASSTLGVLAKAGASGSPIGSSSGGLSSGSIGDVKYSGGSSGSTGSYGITGGGGAAGPNGAGGSSGACALDSGAGGGANGGGSSANCSTSLVGGTGPTGTAGGSAGTNSSYAGDGANGSGGGASYGSTYDSGGNGSTYTVTSWGSGYGPGSGGGGNWNIKLAHGLGGNYGGGSSGALSPSYATQGIIVITY